MRASKSLIRSRSRHRQSTEAEAAEVGDRLNSTEVRGGRLLDDWWVVVPAE
jgi:hypothetical protein